MRNIREIKNEKSSRKSLQNTQKFTLGRNPSVLVERTNLIPEWMHNILTEWTSIFTTIFVSFEPRQNGRS